MSNEYECSRGGKRRRSRREGTKLVVRRVVRRPIMVWCCQPWYHGAAYGVPVYSMLWCGVADIIPAALAGKCNVEHDSTGNVSTPKSVSQPSAL